MKRHCFLWIYPTGDNGDKYGKLISNENKQKHWDKQHKKNVRIEYKKTRLKLIKQKTKQKINLVASYVIITLWITISKIP